MTRNQNIISSELTVIFLDKEDFSYQDLETRPLAGAQTAFVELVRAMAMMVKVVKVRNNTKEEYVDSVVEWKQLDSTSIPDGDIYIVNRSATLLPLVPRNKKIFFWLHNEAKYLLRPSSLKNLFKYYPILVFSGKYHRSTLLIWFLFRTKIIPYGISLSFISSSESKHIPRPKAIFTSNPLRSLDWLVDRWKVIHRSVPDAELHVFSGPSTYGTWGNSVSSRMEKILDYVKANNEHGIVLREPVRKEELINEIRTSRLMLYKGDRAETFCLAIAEAQAIGLPCIVQDFGSMKERVTNNINGFVTKTDAEFEEHTVTLLTDDNVWLSMHNSLRSKPPYQTWSQTAKMFTE